MARIRKIKPPKVVTVIGHGTMVEGHVRFAGALHLDGRIKGEVTGEPESNATLIISEQGAIEGDVRVDQLITDGLIAGDVRSAGSVELGSHARITGTLYYQLLEMAMGAEVNGKLVHGSPTEPQRLGYDGREPDAADGMAEDSRDKTNAGSSSGQSSVDDSGESSKAADRSASR